MKRWSRRVLRGGSFNNQPGNVRCANRDRNQPTTPNANNGFRVALGSLVRQESNRQKRRVAIGPRRPSTSIPAFTSCSRMSGTKTRCPPGAGIPPMREKAPGG